MEHFESADKNDGKFAEYRKYFSEEKAYGLLKKLRKSTRNKTVIGDTLGVLIEALGNLLSAFGNPETPNIKKFEIAAAIGYILLPTDLINDTIPVLGYTDDVAVTSWVVAEVRKYSTFDLKILDQEIDSES